ncbi:3-ketoacyl-CoA reductase [Purpureocillium lavendulum]|uniref:3-ketoacyl-CoA reductase n=1 Tax=Purpureocillium lavendulum TaxID=1247861 RepID=A0AB34G3I5_9HYPO|nr:3-ketoacyl-CoA reductase [Purpureocillium lavendulum]
MANLLVNTLAVVGVTFVAYVVHAIWDFVSLHFFLPTQPLRLYHRGDGPGPAYALITGGSAGIGLGVALELVRQGFGVILLGHLADELEQAKRTLVELSPSGGAEVRTVVMDARTATPKDLEELVHSLDDQALQVSILVNNVGGNPIELPPLRKMSTYSCADVDAVIAQNARFMACLTALMLPLLSRAPSRPDERSLIINMSSAGYVGSPFLAMYGATKAFNLALSRGIARELDIGRTTRHVDCLAIIPGDVRSQGNSRGVTPGAPRWDAYGRCLLRTVDGAVSRKMRDLSPYWKHDLELRAMPWLDEARLTTELTKVIKRKKDAWDEYFSKTQ